MAIYNTSTLQRRAWLLQRSGPLLFSQGIMQIDGTLDRQQLGDAVQRVVAANDALRTTYIQTKENFFPFQQVADQSAPVIKWIDIHEGEGNPLRFVEEHLRLQHEAAQESAGCRVTVFIQSPVVAFFVVLLPALSADTHSVYLFLQQVCSAYSGGDVTGEEVIQYPQYTAFQEQLLEEPEQEAVDFWAQHRFDTHASDLNLFPLHGTHVPSRQTIYREPLDAALVATLGDWAEASGISLSAALLAALMVLNYRRNLAPALVGHVLSERSYEELADTFGLLSKTVPAGFANLDEMSFRELAQKLSTHLEEAAAWQDYFPVLDDSPAINGVVCGYAFGFELIEADALPAGGDVRFSIIDISGSTDSFRVKLTVSRLAGVWTAAFSYDADDYSAADIAAYAEQYIHLLSTATGDADVPVTALSLPATAGDAFNHELPPADYTDINTIFNQQASLHPDTVAVIGDGRSLTYAELRNKAAAIAGYLRAEGIGPEQVVAITADRSPEMVAGILGIIGAGGTYLPIDPQYPEARVRYMIEDSGSQLLIVTNSDYFQQETSCKQANMRDILAYEGEANVDNRSRPEHAAYIIYTSGSTGRPKGVLVEHRNLHSLVRSLQTVVYNHFPAAPLRIGLLASFSFDGSIKQIFASLLLGHTLCIVPDHIKLDGNALLDWLNEQQVQVCDATPMHLDILGGEEVGARNSSLIAFLCGGQQLLTRTVERLRSRLGSTLEVVNLYGPTECCVNATAFRMEEHTLSGTTAVPIGQPLPNTHIYIVDAAQRPVPAGIVGEIFIGGHGVARGYTGSAELTSERFIDYALTGERVYRTGDLARRRTDGNIEFIGRADEQVKIRGYRIELDEIREKLMGISKIRDCALAVKQDRNGNDMIVAYLVTLQNIGLSELTSTLRSSLPDYMIPAWFVRLRKIPVSVNGKIRKEELPQPEGIAIQAEVRYEAPRNIVEQKLVEIFEDILGRQNIGIHDNFYETGGDSIKAVQMSGRLYRIGYKVDVRELFLNPTIAGLATKVTEIEENSDQSFLTGPARMAPIQAHYFSQPDTEMNHFNQSICFHSEESLNVTDVQTIFLKLLEHHDELRAVFIPEGTNVRQEITALPDHLEVVELHLDQMDETEAEQQFEEKTYEWQGSMKLDEGPLMRLALVHMKDEDRLLVIIHHLVTDGFSWRILFEDIGILFRQSREKARLELPLKTDSYKLWAETLYERANSEPFLTRAAYWKKLAALDLPIIPKDQQEDTCYNYNTKTVQAALSKEMSMALISDVNQAYGTETNEILLSAFGMAVNEAYGMDRVGVYMVGHGRDETVTGLNISRTVGWFNIIYPFVVNVSGSTDPLDIIGQVKNDARAVPDKGFGYSILKFLTQPEYKKDFEDRLRPNIMFNYLGQFDTDVKNLSFSVENIHDSAIGRNRRQRFELIVSSILANGRLSIGIQYNDRQYSEAVMEKLLAAYMEKLELLIQPCLTETQPV